VSGAWVTWPADVLTWPGVTDITPQLDQAIAALRWHRDIADGRYDYTAAASAVTFHLRVRWGITEVPTKGYASAALHQCLPPVGLGLHRRDVGGHIVATLRLAWWPTDFDWWPR
jgi:hypothetical protein